MKKLIAGLIVTIVAAALLTVVPILGAAFGAFAGWVVGWFFDETILGIFRQFGITAEMWQLGAFLGFVGGFLRATARVGGK